MSMFHLDKNGFLPHPFPRSLLVSTHITKAEELYLGVGEEEVMIGGRATWFLIVAISKKWTRSLNLNEKEPRQVSSTSNTSVRDQPPVPKIRRTDRSKGLLRTLRLSSFYFLIWCDFDAIWWGFRRHVKKVASSTQVAAFTRTFQLIRINWC